MTLKNWTIFGLIGLTTITVTALADIDGGIFRTTAYLHGISQRPNTTTPIIDFPPLAGHQIVNLALGRDVNDTNFPDQVMALALSCDLQSGNFVIYDRSNSNVVGLIASSTRLVSVHNVTTNDTRATATGKTNDLVRFGMNMDIQLTGNATNGLLGGNLTVVGRIHVHPVTGCPLPGTLTLDKDTLDKTFGIKPVPKKEDKDTVVLTNRTGMANCMGLIDVVGNGVTNTIIVPVGTIDIRYALPNAPL